MNKLAAVLLLFSLTSLAEPGDYDPSFGDGGVKKFNFNSDPSIYETGNGVALGPAGTYYLGSNNAAPNGDYFWQLSRHLPDGSLDTSFNFDGIATANFNTPNNGENDKLRTIYVQEDGKILLLGDIENGDSSGNVIAIARFNTDGTLDSSFSGDGKTTIQIGNAPNSYSLGFMIKTDPLGKVLIAANSNYGSQGSTVIRLLPNGQLDNSFNLTGIKQLNINGLDGSATFIEAAAGNKILVTGSVNVDGLNNTDFYAARLNNDGSFDTTFNATGFRIIPFDLMPDGYDNAVTGLLTDNQQLFIAGASLNNGNPNMSIAGLNPDGSMNNNFGFNGIAAVSMNDAAGVYDIALQEDGKMLLCGINYDSTNDFYYPTFVRLNPDGFQDFDFGDFGVAILDADPLSPDFTGLITSCVIDDNQFLVNSGYMASANNNYDHIVSLSRIDLGLDLIFKNSFE